MSERSVSLTIDGLPVSVPEGTSILEATRLFGIHIPTLCHDEGLSSYGACRLCIVEIGPADKSRVVSSCTYRCEDGLEVRTNTRRILNARKILLEMMVCSSPGSKTIQDLASAHGVTQQRFQREEEDCILCGLCVRMCAEQMMASAIDFVGRGPDRKITTPFDEVSELCRHCGGCMYICPVCMVRCAGTHADTTICSGCLNLSPSCVDVYDSQQCWMPPSCGTCIRPEGEYLAVSVRAVDTDSDKDK